MPADPCKQLKLEVQPTFFLNIAYYIFRTVFKSLKPVKLIIKPFLSITFYLFYMSYISTCFKFKQKIYTVKKLLVQLYF